MHMYSVSTVTRITYNFDNSVYCVQEQHFYIPEGSQCIISPDKGDKAVRSFGRPNLNRGAQGELCHFTRTSPNIALFNAKRLRAQIGDN